MNWDTKGLRLPMWTVYERPLEFPNSYVVRLFDFDKPTRQFAVTDTLKAARKLLPIGLYCIGREEGDEPQIVETWV